jgi:hypothetical protein
MKELDPWVFLAVLQEMLGPLLWVLLALAGLATIGFLAVLVRDRGRLRARRLVWAEAAGLLGGIAAVLLAHAVTDSGFADIGGPIDWVVLATIFLAGGFGTTIAAYAVLGLTGRNGRRHRIAGA